MKTTFKKAKPRNMKKYKKAKPRSYEETECMRYSPDESNNTL